MVDWKKRVVSFSVAMVLLYLLMQSPPRILILINIILFIVFREYYKIQYEIMMQFCGKEEQNHVKEFLIGLDLVKLLPVSSTVFVFFMEDQYFHVMILVSVMIVFLVRMRQFSKIMGKYTSPSGEQSTYQQTRLFTIAFQIISLDLVGLLFINFPMNLGWTCYLKYGIGALVLWLGGSWQTDNGALITGSILGRTPFSKAISPKKTWEGVSGGVVVSVCTMILCAYIRNLPYLDWLPDFSVKQYIVLGFGISIFAILGDLCESFIKRVAKVKDSGGAMPGHGGIFDKIDSLLFTSPVVYLFFQYSAYIATLGQ